MRHHTASAHSTGTDEFDEITIREISIRLNKDPRTVRKVLRGERIRGRLAQAEIEREIARRRSIERTEAKR